MDGMLDPIVWSAAELMRGGEIERIKVCSNHTCGWLFVDRSKNRSRRWCQMSDCGNNEKSRRFLQKKAGRRREE
jgi:predicted RNA-binding Zn ribbon-like protein